MNRRELVERAHTAEKAVDAEIRRVPPDAKILMEKIQEERRARAELRKLDLENDKQRWHSEQGHLVD